MVTNGARCYDSGVRKDPIVGCILARMHDYFYIPVIRSWLQKQDVRILERPAQPLDLNPIEHAWYSLLNQHPTANRVLIVVVNTCFKRADPSQIGT